MTRYLTAAEYRSAPTAVDTTRLAYNGGAGDQDAELLRCIARASSWIDNTLGFGLAATVAYRAQRVPLTRTGILVLYPSISPLQSLETLAVGPNVATLTDVTDLAYATIVGDHFEVPYPGPSLTAAGLAGMAAIGTPSTPTARYSFVHGWPNTALTATVTAGATSLDVADTTGMTAATATRPATVLTIVDGANSEEVTVTAVTNATTVQVTPTTYTHTYVDAGANAIAVHAMPEVFKWAATLLTNVAVRTRGNDAFTMREPGPAAQLDPVSGNDWTTVRDILGRLGLLR